MTTIVCLQIFGILILRMQDDRNLFSQAFRTVPAWSINSEHTELGTGTSSKDKHLEKDVGEYKKNSSKVKLLMISLSDVAGIFLKSVILLATSLDDRQNPFIL